MDKKNHFQSAIPIILFIILTVLSYLVIQPFMLVLFLSAILAYGLYPVYKSLTKRTNRENLSAFIICLVVLLLIILPSAFMVKELAEESYTVYLAVKNNDFLSVSEDCQGQLCQNLDTFLNNPNVKFQLEKISSGATNYLIKKTSELVLSIPTLMVNLFVLLFTLFYFLRDGSAFIKGIGYYLGIQKKNFELIVCRLGEVTKGIIYGYVLVAGVQGALGTLGFLILGVPSPFFWGIVMAILALIPYGGAGIVWLPASAVLFVQGMQGGGSFLIAKGIILLVYGTFVISGIDNILRPKIISDKAKIHPGIILVGMLGGIYFFGAFGVLIGPMILALTIIVIETFLGKMPHKKELQKILKEQKQAAKKENNNNK